MRPFYRDDTVTLYAGRAVPVLRSLPDASADCVVTSPPYWGLRDYGMPGQYGLEATPAEYIANLCTAFAEVRRVLAADGTCWLNLGDTYATHQKGDGGQDKSRLDGRLDLKRPLTVFTPDRAEKNLLGLPWRVALALQDDGWILRNAIVWHKPNAMPESVRDRLSTRHEYLFLLTKSPRYWFDLDAIREPLARPEALAENIVFGGTKGPGSNNGGKLGGSARRSGGNPSIYGQSSPRQRREGRDGRHQATDHRIDRDHQSAHPAGRNPGDVWSISTQPFTGAHFAVMPMTLAERCVAAGCKPGGVVLDPFSGSGTTGLAAARHGHRYIGIDLNPDYLSMSLRTRLAQAGLADTPDATADAGEVAG